MVMPILTCHDELVVECPEGQAEEVVRIRIRNQVLPSAISDV
jgi:hypothetical protein